MNEVSSGSYGGCGNVYQLGNYTNTPDLKTAYNKQIQNREDVLNTLIGGSYAQNEIKKCGELISPDKKKGVKIKSEN